MKMFTSKKGFTLIEMLVVIAIIAVLVAIIVPTVTSSTTKAKAATDAANLRSALAEATIKALNDTSANYTADALSVPDRSKLDSALTFSCTVTQATGNNTGVTITCTYGKYDATDFAGVADGTKTYSSSEHKIS